LGLADSRFSRAIANGRADVARRFRNGIIDAGAREARFAVRDSGADSSARTGRTGRRIAAAAFDAGRVFRSRNVGPEKCTRTSI